MPTRSNRGNPTDTAVVPDPADPANPFNPLAGRSPAAIVRSVGLVLLPLRVYLAVVFLYAGISKIADRRFLDDSSPLSIHASVTGVRDTSPIGGLLGQTLTQVRGGLGDALQRGEGRVVDGGTDATRSAQHHEEHQHGEGGDHTQHSALGQKLGHLPMLRCAGGRWQVAPPMAA